MGLENSGLKNQSPTGQQSFSEVTNLSKNSDLLTSERTISLLALGFYQDPGFTNFFSLNILNLSM